LQVLANSHTHQQVPIDQIGLDRDNPRIQKFIEMYGDNPSPKQFYLALGAAGDDEGDSSTNFQKLKNSILTNKGIIQPVILNKRDGKLVCIEGNTRVALYRQFKEEKAPGSWDSIPALVYDNMEDNDVDAIRLQVHLVGTRAWDPYSKAKYLHHLRYKKELPMGWIVDFCGGRQKEVTESIQAYIDMEQHYRPIVDEGNFDTSRFSGFIELQKPGIKQSIAESGFETSDFAKWIAAEKFPQLQMVRQLPRILKHPKARVEFLKTGRDARHAASFLEQPAVSKALADAALSQLAAALKNSIYDLPWLERDKICKDPGGESYQQLNEALDALRSLLNVS
jgi:hypothetical protein